MPLGPSPDSPLQTVHAAFTAHSFPELTFLPSVTAGLSSRFDFAFIVPYSSGNSGYLSNPEVSTSCHPSPCGRLSRPPTTMAAPTPSAVIGRLLALACR